FARQVAQQLQRHGIAAIGPIGAGAQPIELALAEHPLVIEFDGSIYHAAATVRDRDRLRRESLEKLGWTVRRVWSAAWIAHHDENPARRLRPAKHVSHRAAAAKNPPQATPPPAARPAAKAVSR